METAIRPAVSKVRAPRSTQLAELQLHVLWEKILKRDLAIELVGPPVRAYSNLLRGIKSLPVRIAA